jgi:ABC-2 type transport system ATP-binding protein
MTSAIDVDDVTVRFGDVTALDGLSLSLAPGKVYGLLGRNGSGKTTLLSLLASHLRATSGRVRIDGEDPFENARLVERICLVRESGDVVETEPVKAVLARTRRLRPNWDQDLADRLVDLFALPLKRAVGKLSRGQRSALGITTALASQSPLTMLDESYLGLDAPSRHAFYDVLLQDYMANPRTFVISTHLIEEVSELFEEVVIIDRGRLVAHESTVSLRERGAAITGPAKVVDLFTDRFDVIAEQQLGGVKSTTVFGELSAEHRTQARDAGLELSPVTLQDLFVNLTSGRGA